VIVFKDLARRAGVVDVEDLKRSDINIVGAHALRKSFSTICRNSGVPPDLVEYMIGHRLKFNGAYYEPSDEKLKEGGINRNSVYKCPNCGTDLKKNWEICPKCGKKVGFTTCDKCGETLSCDWGYCPKCGKKL